MILTKCRDVFLELNRDKMAQKVKERKCPDIVVPLMNTARDLGMLSDNDLSFDIHICRVTRTAFYHKKVSKFRKIENITKSYSKKPVHAIHIAQDRLLQCSFCRIIQTITRTTSPCSECGSQNPYMET